jgi:hypothetical protein
MLWNLRQSMKSRTYLILLVLLNGYKDTVMRFWILFIVESFLRPPPPLFNSVIGCDLSQGGEGLNLIHILYTAYSQCQFRLD